MALPAANEPLRLADGRIVHPGGDITTDPSKLGLVEIPTHQEAQRIITQTRRKLTDLPAMPKQMNAIGAVLSYVLFGLDDEEIAISTSLTVEQVQAIKDADPFRQLYDVVAQTVLEQQAETVRDVFAKNAKNAANTMVEALQAGTRTDRMAAARDILDRSGHRPADVIEHRHRMDGGLVIEIVKRDEHKVPTIDMGAI
jgi:hypothetical protein